jgi:hypothetical protein
MPDMLFAALSRRIASVALVGTLASACSTAESAERSTAPLDLLVRAREFSFNAPDTIPAGLVTIRLVNDGSEMHHMQLVHLNEAHTFDEYRETAGRGDPLPSWVTPVGGPNASSPSEDLRVTLDLAAGRYAMLCLIPSFYDRVGHFRKGMIRPLIVLDSAAPARRPPVADTRIVLNDYSFDVTPVVTAGRHTFKVENVSRQSHEIVIQRLIPGKTMDDLLAWARRLDGPPPADPNGGTTEIAPGGVNLMAVTFVPGTYVLVCFARDAKDGRSHLAHGMLREVQVN